MTIAKCPVCQSERRPKIDKMLLDGLTQKVVLGYMISEGMSFPGGQLLAEMHQRTALNLISRHKIKHMPAIVIHKQAVATQRASDLARETSDPEFPIQELSGRDAAVLIRDRGVERLVNREIDVTVAETLRAQELLDRRLEKQGDRDMIIAMAGVLYGAVPYLPEPLEGEVLELGSGE